MVAMSMTSCIWESRCCGQAFSTRGAGCRGRGQSKCQPGADSRSTCRVNVEQETWEHVGGVVDWRYVTVVSVQSNENASTVARFGMARKLHT